jgi:hypothetical protein
MEEDEGPVNCLHLEKILIGDAVVWRTSPRRLDHPVGVRLAGDLARSGSNPYAAVFSDGNTPAGLRLLRSRSRPRSAPTGFWAGLLELWYGIPAQGCEPGNAVCQASTAYSLRARV